MSGTLTLQTWTDKLVITGVSDVRQDGRDIITEGDGGTIRIQGETFGTWAFIKDEDGVMTTKSGLGYFHCEEQAND